jgi:hypothetical protein
MVYPKSSHFDALVFPSLFSIDRLKRQKVSLDALLEQKNITLKTTAHPGNLVHFLRQVPSNYKWIVDVGEYAGCDSTNSSKSVPTYY